MLKSLRQWFGRSRQHPKSTAGRATAAARPAAARCLRPSAEVLEDRTLASVSAPFTIAGSNINETAPATASAANGMKVVIFAEEAAQGNNDIKAKLYNVNGNQVGATIDVSTAANDDSQPDVSMDAQGNFVVVWTRYYAGLKDYDVEYSRYSNTGSSLGSGSVASSSAYESDAHVAMNAAGKFVVSYTSLGVEDSEVLAKRYDAQANQLGATMKVAALTDRYEYASRIDRADGGRFAISYLWKKPNGTDETLILKRYAGDGTLLDKNKIAVGGTPISSVGHDVGMDNAGNCVVVFDTGATGSDHISFRRVTNDGVVHAKHALTSVSCYRPTVAVNRKDGDFVLAFNFQAPGTSNHAVAWEVSKSGAFKGSQDFGADSFGAAVSIDALDRYFVAYEHEYSASDIDVKAAFGTLS